MFCHETRALSNHFLGYCLETLTNFAFWTEGPVLNEYPIDGASLASQREYFHVSHELARKLHFADPLKNSQIGTMS